MSTLMPNPTEASRATNTAHKGPQTGVEHAAVVGLQWGDEGKGKIVDLLAPDFDLVIRYNGGANAGHSVQVGDDRYALHQVPSGILYPDKHSVLGNGVVVDPGALLGEIEGLRRRGVRVEDNLRISDRAHVVFPYHQAEDLLREQAINHARGGDSVIGTTGRGIGPCYADKALRSTAVRVGELLDPDRLAEKLRYIVSVKEVVLAALAKQCGQSFEPIDAAQLAKQYGAYGQALRPHITNTATLLHDSIDAGRRLLFEGANATLLDIDHGTYPFVTSSNCSSLGIGTGTGVPGRNLARVLGVVKAYATRVGGGPMPTELDDQTGERIRKAGNEFGTTTGRPRRCGWLDLVAVKYTARISGATELCLTLLDVLSGLDPLKLCVGYRVGGQAIDGFPSDAAVLAEAEPVYEQMPGFSEPITDCTSIDRLPPNAMAYVRRIEEHVGVPVRMIGVGPRRDQAIHA